MSASMVRLHKEARALFWPWFAVMTCGALPALVSTSSTRKLNLLAFFVGVPLLAALSLGNEFHQRTITLWLTQPASRLRLWSEKMAVVAVAVLSAALLAGTVTFTFTWPHLGFTYRAAAFLCILAATAAAPYWTLASRSSLGGFVVIGCHLAAAFWTAKDIADADSLSWGPGPGLPSVAITAVFVAAIAYSTLTTCLSARKLARLQLTGGSEDGDLLASGPEVMSRAWVRWFRFRPHGVTRNLLRKEFRLLQPYALFSLVILGYLAIVTVLRVVVVFPIPIPDEHAVALRFLVEWVVFATLGSSFILLFVFAGILSLGEERSRGTHAWHMVLPVSPLRQWLAKLVVAMLAGFAGAVLLPLLVIVGIGTFFGSPYMFVNLRELRDWMIVVPVMTFAGFWCACAASGMVRAALWVAIAPMIVFFARPAGTRIGESLVKTTGTLRDLLVARLHLSPLASSSLIDAGRANILWLFVPAVLVGVAQSYRLFRLQPRDDVPWMLRCLALPVVVTVLWCTIASAGFLSSRWEPLEETRTALDRLHPGAANLQLNSQELRQNSSLSPLTQQWLDGARITIAADRSQLPGYLAIIHLAGGTDCRLKVTRFGGAASSCGKALR